MLDLASYAQGNCGIPYAIALEGGKPGPSVLVTALVHGNEVCGALALDFLLKKQIRPLRGRLTLAFCNAAAYQAPDGTPRTRPVRYLEEDLNRVWSAGILDGPRDSRELARARELRPLLEGADLLLDLHSVPVPGDFPPLVLCGSTARARALALAIGVPHDVVCDAGHAAGARLRDYGGFGEEAGAKTALLVECGRNRTPESANVALDATLRFLLHHHMVDADFAAPHLERAPPRAQRVVQVTDAVPSSEHFRFAAEYKSMAVLPRAGTTIAYDGERVIRTPYDDCVLVMPVSALPRGHTAVRLGKVIGARQNAS